MNIKQSQEVLSLINYALNSVNPDLFEWVGESTNLKMYDAAYHQCDFIEDDEEDWFQRWCDEVYNFEFLPLLKETGVETEYIGRTSTFYFVPEESDSFFSLAGLDEFEKVNNKERRFYAFMNYIHYNYNFELDVEYSEDWKMQSDLLNLFESYMEEYEMSYQDLLEDLTFLDMSPDELANEFKYFCTSSLKPLNRMYDYLSDFKDNQVELFEEYVKQTLEYMGNS